MLFESRTLHGHAKVAELADALDLGSSGETRGGSSPPFRTINLFPASANSSRPVDLSGPYEIRVGSSDGERNPFARRTPSLQPRKANGRPAGRPLTKPANLFLPLVEGRLMEISLNGPAGLAVTVHLNVHNL